MIENVYEQQLILTVITLLFFISVTNNVFTWLHLWASKGYRLDRVIIHCAETIEGRLLLFGWMQCIKIGAVSYYLVSIVYEDILTLFPTIVFGVYALSVLRIAQRIINKTFYVPPFNSKTVPIMAVVFGLMLLLVRIPLLDNYFWLLISEKILTLSIFLYFIFWVMVHDFLNDVQINKAIKKREKYKGLLSVGIIGSYGKGETKEFLYSVLSKKFNVLKTGQSKYLAEELAETIIKKLTKKKDIILADLNCYRPGDLTNVISILRPHVVVLTAIGKQHVSLFRTQSRIRAEYEEAIKIVPRTGYVMYQWNDDQSKKILKSHKIKKVSYGISQGSDTPHADIVAHTVSLKPFHMSFNVTINGKLYGKFTVHLVGEQVIAHLLPAIYMGIQHDVPLKEIKSAIASLSPLPHIMQPYRTSKNVQIIDDTYRVNRESIDASIMYMKNFKGKKVVVLQPMTELGSSADKEHYEIAKQIASTCDYLFVTNKNSIHAIQKGVMSAKSTCTLEAVSHKSVAEFVNSELKKGDVVVFLGKQSRPGLNILSKDFVQYG